MATRSHTAHHRRRRVGTARDRAGAAYGAAQRDPRRPLRPATAALVRCAAVVDRVRSRRLPPRRRTCVGGRHPAAAPRRSGPRAQRGRGVAGPRRPGPGAVRHRLRDGEPARHLPRHARDVSPGGAAPHGAVLPGAALDLDRLGTWQQPQPSGRRALTGHPLRDRVRPGVRRVEPRLPARRGQRPGDARRRRVDAGLRPARAGRRDPATGRRRVERRLGAAQELAARRRRPVGGGPARQRARRQRPRLRRSREPGTAAIPVRDVRDVARRAAATAVGADLLGG